MFNHSPPPPQEALFPGLPTTPPFSAWVRIYRAQVYFAIAAEPTTYGAPFAFKRGIFTKGFSPRCGLHKKPGRRVPDLYSYGEEGGQ